jgi:hypothetical protein
VTALLVVAEGVIAEVETPLAAIGKESNAS